MQSLLALYVKYFDVPHYPVLRDALYVLLLVVVFTQIFAQQSLF